MAARHLKYNTRTPKPCSKYTGSELISSATKNHSFSEERKGITQTDELLIHI